MEKNMKKGVQVSGSSGYQETEKYHYDTQD